MFTVRRSTPALPALAAVARALARTVTRTASLGAIAAGVVALGSIVTAGAAHADELKMTPAPQDPAGRPTRGMSMDKVESAYGEPARRIPAVGDPPISRWEYPGFVVYFEHNLVIHSVATG